MAISLIDNLKIQNKKQNVERDSFATIADMVSYSPNYLPNIFHAMCEETGKMYVYNVNNDEDPDLGKWRVLEGSGGGTADVPIEKIKVNGELQTPVNKVVDITVPDAYDDTDIRAELANINTSLDGKLDKTFTGDDVANKILSTDKDGNVVLKNGGSGEGTAETTTYTNADYPSYTNVDLALDALFSKVYYVKPTCSLSASKAGGTFEMGTTITAPITFTWTTNKAITSQTLTGCTLTDASVRTAIYNTNVTTDKTFTLSVSDGKNSASSSVSYKFLNNIFWGSAATAETYDSAFIRALSNKKLASAVKGTYSFNIASGEYGFWAVPSNMTISSVWIGGF